MFILDTNICIYIIKQKPPHVFERFRSIPLGKIGISSITLSELNYGVMKSALPEKNKLALAQFLIPLEILPFDNDAAISYGKIRADLENKGTPIGPLDTLIAAHALSLDQTLVTNNVKEFSRVTSLKIDNWV
ncbi:MAG: type II toxin-antitoxin system tRNA(fMet)-specific endonuclease VapC [Imperialibacter sp.]|uniref:type II toxin-antitoxin system tRNA(fMet)-specific endonuclease VapC n=1 Tax=Imperialibacter sp. TaxID=2038411 RepID=UPI0030DC65D2|tara:strand:- start:199 stop:594 length:396 start_codon:yes stop_codon:yes gene_type:complete